MKESSRITSVSFRNYKALKNYSISLNEFNVLVGPNNSGKSTIIGAFRLLAEGIRKAQLRNPEYVNLRSEESYGYQVPLDDLPIATENVFSDYDDTDPATIEFRLSNQNKLKIIFPAKNLCYLVCKTNGRPVRSTSDFKREYDISVGFVPVVGPVEHNEPLNQKETARRALLTHRASRNFRNIWYHFPEKFNEFRELLTSTWLGMDIEPPKVDYESQKNNLHMFCPEGRVPREIFWAGFGFQVWCQMLTFIVRAKEDSLLIIDEPDIYLHSDLQRQLFNLLKSLGPDIIIATHSTEIITEADPGDLLLINKKSGSAKRISNASQLQSVFGTLGSNLNPTLTQLAKSRRAVFVEGKDFQILSAFARKLDYNAVAIRSDFAVIPMEGFNPSKAEDLAKGIEITLGGTILKAVILDRDYRSDAEISEISKHTNDFSSLTHIHRRKEIENYLLETQPIDRAVRQRIADYNKRNDTNVTFEESIEDILLRLTDPLKSRLHAQYIAKGNVYEKAKNKALDAATINESLIVNFENAWATLQGRISIIPGKEVMASLSQYLQDNYKISVSSKAIINEMRPHEVSSDITQLIEQLDVFRRLPVNDK